MLNFIPYQAATIRYLGGGVEFLTGQFFISQGRWKASIQPEMFVCTPSRDVRYHSLVQ